jgi:hypothetical protein
MHRKAHGTVRTGGNNGTTAAEISRCRRCEIGQHHRRGEPHPLVKLVQIAAKPSGAESKPRASRFDPWTGETLKPYGSRMRGER